MDLTTIDGAIDWIMLNRMRRSEEGDRAQVFVTLFGADHNEARVKEALAYCYDHGIGCKQDKEHAFKLIFDEDETILVETAIGIGYALKAHELYRDDIDEAFKSCKKAAYMGMVGAQNWMAGGHAGGENDPWQYNHAEVVKYTEMAASQGDMEAIKRLILINLGDYDDMDGKAKGFKPDFDRAYRMAIELIDSEEAKSFIEDNFTGDGIYNHDPISPVKFNEKFNDASTAQIAFKSNETKLRILMYYNQKQYDNALQQTQDAEQEQPLVTK